mmetsp:Transcript_10721/g.13076  ORF Transcript_10721/g.13076 Transcript_10721/m.13076 type:complete len:670 (+) Transcript_10721:1-2010(+)
MSLIINKKETCFDSLDCPEDTAEKCTAKDTQLGRNECASLVNVTIQQPSAISESTERLKDEELDTDIDIYQLESDIFSILFVSDIFSGAAMFSILLFALQMTILVLAMINLLDDPDKGNFFKVPMHTQGVVRAAQAAAIFISIAVSDDITTSLDFFSVKVPKDYNIRLKWAASNLCRFIEGFVGIMVAFIFIVQATEALDLFLDFAALTFVSELDNIGFVLAEKGYVPVHIQNAVKKVKSTRMYFTSSRTHIPIFGRTFKIRAKILKRIIFFVPMIVLYAGWTFLILVRQRNSYYFRLGCESFEVKFESQYSYNFFEQSRGSEKLVKFNTSDCRQWESSRTSPISYSSFSDSYFMDTAGSNKYLRIENPRPVYYQRNKTPSKDPNEPFGKISYCEEIEAWVFTIEGVCKVHSENDCNWLARSPKTEALSLDTVEENDWEIWTGIRHETSVDITCVECNDNKPKDLATDLDCNHHGQCTEKSCECNGFWVGFECEVCAACSEFEVLVKDGNGREKISAFNDTRRGELKNWNGNVFKRLADQNSPKKDNVVSLYGRPVYYEINDQNKNATIDEDKLHKSIIYSGSRYWILNLTSKCQDFISPVTCLEGYHSAWFFDETNKPEYMSEVTQNHYPSGLKWFKYEAGNILSSRLAEPFDLECMNAAEAKTCEYL